MNGAEARGAGAEVDGVDPGSGGGTWDNFNSQMGAFGVSRGAEAGVLVSGVVNPRRAGAPADASL